MFFIGCLKSKKKVLDIIFTIKPFPYFFVKYKNLRNKIVNYKFIRNILIDGNFHPNLIFHFAFYPLQFVYMEHYMKHYMEHYMEH